MNSERSSRTIQSSDKIESNGTLSNYYFDRRAVTPKLRREENRGIESRIRPGASWLLIGQICLPEFGNAVLLVAYGNWFFVEMVNKLNILLSRVRSKYTVHCEKIITSGVPLEDFLYDNLC